MPKLIKCPRCQIQVDVTGMTEGSTIRCPDCGGMARIPTGKTGVGPAVQASIPPAAAKQETRSRQRDTGTRKKETKSRVSGGPTRSTSLFKRMAGSKAPGEKSVSQVRAEGRSQNAPAKSSAGLVIGIAAGALAIVGGLAFAVMGKKEKEPPPVKASTVRKAPPPPKPMTPASPSSSSSPAGPPDVPAGTFQPGARPIALSETSGATPIRLNEDQKKVYEGIAATGNVDAIVKEDYAWVTYAIDGLLSDSEMIAKTSFQALAQITQKRKIDTQVNVKNYQSARARADEYNYWAFQWWLRRSNQDAVAGWASESGAPVSAVNPGPTPLPTPVAKAAAGGEQWARTMEELRSGGGFHDESTVQGQTFARIKRMGKSAYPHLIEYISNEDVMLARAAVAVLKELTQRESPMPTDATKAKIKEEWEGWYKASP